METGNPGDESAELKQKRIMQRLYTRYKKLESEIQEKDMMYKDTLESAELNAERLAEAKEQIAQLQHDIENERRQNLGRESQEEALKDSELHVQRLTARLKEASTYKVELHKSQRLVQKLEKKTNADQVVVAALQADLEKMGDELEKSRSQGFPSKGLPGDVEKQEQADVSRLEQQIQAQFSALETLRTQNNDYQSRLEGLEKENATLKQELSQAEAAASTAAKRAVEATELRTKLDSSERAMRDLTDRYEECRMSRDSLLTDGDALEDENRLLLQQVQEMQLSMGDGVVREHAEIVQLLGTESELPERVQQLVELADSSASLKELCNEQSHEINCLRNKLDAREGALTLDTSMQARLAEYEKIVELLAGEESPCKRVVELLEVADASDTLRDEYRMQSTSIQNLENEKAVDATRLHALEQQCSGLRDQISLYQGTIERLTHRVSQLCDVDKSNVGDVSDATFDDCEAQFESIENIIEELARQRKAHIELLDQQQQALLVSDTVVQKLERKTHMMAAGLEDSRNCLGVLEQHLRQPNDVTKASGDDALLEKLERLQQQLDEVSQERDRFGDKAKELHQQGRRALKKCAAHKDESEKAKQEVARLEALLDAKTKHIQALDRELYAEPSKSAPVDGMGKDVEELSKAEATRPELPPVPSARPTRPSRPVRSVQAPGRPRMAPRSTQSRLGRAPPPPPIPERLEQKEELPQRKEDEEPQQKQLPQKQEEPQPEERAPMKEEPADDMVATASLSDPAPAPKRSWFSRWFRSDPDEKKVARADLSEDTSFYYDKDLGRWVDSNPVADSKKKEKKAPPPRPSNWKATSDATPAAEDKTLSPKGKSSSLPPARSSTFSVRSTGVSSRYAAFGTDIGFSSSSPAAPSSPTAAAPRPARRRPPPAASRARQAPPPPPIVAHEPAPAPSPVASDSDGRAEEELQRARAEIARLKAELASERKRSAEENERHLRTIDDLESELNALRSASGPSKNEERLQQEVARLQRMIADLRRELQEASSGPPDGESGGAAEAEATRLVDELKGVIDRLEQFEAPPDESAGNDVSLAVSCTKFFIFAACILFFAVCVAFVISTSSISLLEGFYMSPLFELFGLGGVQYPSPPL